MLSMRLPPPRRDDDDGRGGEEEQEKEPPQPRTPQWPPHATRIAPHRPNRGVAWLPMMNDDGISQMEGGSGGFLEQTPMAQLLAPTSQRQAFLVGNKPCRLTRAVSRLISLSLFALDGMI